MKIFIFDIDNTIYSSKANKVFPNTIKLLSMLKANPDNILGYATGRGEAKLNVIDEIRHFFDIKISINGALISINDEIVYDNPLPHDVVEMIVKHAQSDNVSIGMVSKDSEAVTFLDEHILASYVSYNRKLPLVDLNFYKDNNIYQLWLYRKDINEAKQIVEKYPYLNVYKWQRGGFDITSPNNSKANAVALVKQRFNNAQLICIGDGHNDVDMIKLADIGIAIDGGHVDIIKHSQLVAPAVEKDMLLDFFIVHKLV